MKWLEKRRLKRQKREEKWLDPYHIDLMSENDFLENRKRLIKKSIGRIVVGSLLLILILLVLVLMWDSMFSYNGWFL